MVSLVFLGAIGPPPIRRYDELPQQAIPPDRRHGRRLIAWFLCRTGRRGRLWPRRAEEGFAVAAAEQEDEPLQVGAQLGDAVGGVANEAVE
jgi:hypothetical protein